MCRVIDMELLQIVVKWVLGGSKRPYLGVLGVILIVLPSRRLAWLLGYLLCCYVLIVYILI
jgi:hypothetical protein